MSTVHAPHLDILYGGLNDECLRCLEHAEHPETSLDSYNLARLRDGHLLSNLDRVAAQNLARWDLQRAMGRAKA